MLFRSGADSIACVAAVVIGFVAARSDSTSGRDPALIHSIAGTAPNLMLFPGIFLIMANYLVVALRSTPPSSFPRTLRPALRQFGREFVHEPSRDHPLPSWIRTLEIKLTTASALLWQLHHDPRRNVIRIVLHLLGDLKTSERLAYAGEA